MAVDPTQNQKFSNFFLSLATHIREENSFYLFCIDSKVFFSPHLYWLGMTHEEISAFPFDIVYYRNDILDADQNVLQLNTWIICVGLFTFHIKGLMLPLPKAIVSFNVRSFL